MEKINTDSNKELEKSSPNRNVTPLMHGKNCAECELLLAWPGVNSGILNISHVTVSEAISVL